jgi:tetratricopeptide (TPR) repeat protein
MGVAKPHCRPILGFRPSNFYRHVALLILRIVSLKNDINTMRIIIAIATLFFFSSLAGQDARLAQQYFQDGEFEKAAIMYEKLYQSNDQNDFFFDRYIDCLLALEKYDECEQAVKKQIKANPQNANLFVLYGKLFERQVMDDKAEEQYRKAINNMPKDRYSITRLANAFISLAKYDLAIEAYEKGAASLKDDEVFAYNLGDLYRRKGDTEKMIQSYLNSLDANPGRINNIQTTFQRFLLPEDYRELQRQLYARIQEKGDAIHYPELLAWVFIQNKDYKNAFRQVRALDIRLRENGGRVYRLAEIAATDGDYAAAIEAYEYIVNEKGISSTFYIEAKREALRCRRTQLVEGYNYSQQDIQALKKEYETFLNEFGRSRTTAGLVLELAELEAFFLNDLDSAIELLSEMIQFPYIDVQLQAEAKLSLADFYLIKGERWEATLLYSQVDKAFKDDILGHEARFRNARLSYFSGDFQWAQAQFDILKASTSKLIANDALDLSVFIMDNLGLDTTARALELFSQAELLAFQNRFEETFQKLDTLLIQFPKHALDDDVFYLKSKVFIKKREYEKAADVLQQIIDNYPEEIRADNALFDLANLYETHLNDQEKALQLYETLFIDYSGSTFAVEARKKYRKLRGDDVQ